MRRLEAQQRNARVLELYDKGLAQNVIVARTGVCSQKVHLILKSAGRQTAGRGNFERFTGGLVAEGNWRVNPHFIEHGNGDQEY